MATVAGMSAPVRLLIVDDDPLVRSGLSLMLGGTPEIELVGQAVNGAEAVTAARAERPDVVLMDLRMPVMDGVEATSHLLALPTPPRVLVLTTFGADEHVVRALAAGAHGFLLKDTPPPEIVAAVLDVAAGDPALSPSVARTLMRKVGQVSPAGAAARAQLATLTDRERDVAEAIGRGLSNADIAGDLHLSVPTVKAHVGRIFTKLDVENRVQIALLVHDAQKA